MKEIALGGKAGAGLVVLVDDADYEAVSLRAWCINRRYKVAYAQATIDYQCVMMHRLIMGYCMPGYCVDHIDGNGLNNQRSNLRVVTYQQNQWNSHGRVGKYSNYKGVSQNLRTPRKPWVAQIRANGKVKHLGNFATEVEAAMAYDRAAFELRGEFAGLNFSPK